MWLIGFPVLFLAPHLLRHCYTVALLTTLKSYSLFSEPMGFSWPACLEESLGELSDKSSGLASSRFSQSKLSHPNFGFWKCYWALPRGRDDDDDDDDKIEDADVSLLPGHVYTFIVTHLFFSPCILSVLLQTDTGLPPWAGPLTSQEWISAG